MSDTFEAHRNRLDEFQGKLNYVEGAVGAAVAIGGKLVAIDVFDKATTCGRVWNRLLSGAILDALEVEHTARRAECADVERVLSGLSDLSWESADAIGEGVEYRAESATGDYASALMFDGTLVHGSIVCAA
jgi:hypothetical protein